MCQFCISLILKILRSIGRALHIWKFCSTPGCCLSILFQCDRLLCCNTWSFFQVFLVGVVCWYKSERQNIHPRKRTLSEWSYFARSDAKRYRLPFFKRKIGILKTGLVHYLSDVGVFCRGVIAVDCCGSIHAGRFFGLRAAFRFVATCQERWTPCSHFGEFSNGKSVTTTDDYFFKFRHSD